MPHRKVDITELYDVLQSKAGTYVICFDIHGLLPINEISTQAGDQAILEALHRIDQAATDEMMLFRIGGDEFTLVTGLTNHDDVQKLADKVLIQNGKPILFEGREIPLSLWAVASKMESTARYNDLFGYLQKTLCEGKKSIDPLNTYL